MRQNPYVASRRKFPCATETISVAAAIHHCVSDNDTVCQPAIWPAFSALTRSVSRVTHYYLSLRRAMQFGRLNAEWFDFVKYRTERCPQQYGC